MAKHLYLFGEVAAWQSDDSLAFGILSSRAVVKDLEGLGITDADELVVHINSPGGEVNEGFAIYNLIRSAGAKSVKTVADGTVASIATVLLLAGDTRTAYKTSDIMIHNPWTFAGGNADQLEKTTEELRAIEERLLDFYVERTGADREKLAELMKAETHLTPEQAKDLGFATEVSEPVKALAKFHTKHMKTPKNPKVAAIVKTAIKALESLGIEFKAMAVETEDGQSIDIDTGDGDDIQVGQTVTKDGEPAADGDYKLKDGRTVKVAEGKVSEIVPAPAEDKDDPKALKAEVARLTAELDAANQAKAKAEADLQAATSEAQEATESLNEVVAYLGTLKVDFKPKAGAQKKFSRDNKDQDKPQTLQEIREGMAKFRAKKVARPV